MIALPPLEVGGVQFTVAVCPLIDAVTPLGRPEADKLTVLLKAFSGVTVMVLVLLVPWTTLRLLGEVESV